MHPLLRFLLACWSGLRAWSGDDAYERYLRAHVACAHPPLSRRAFYRDYLDRRGRRPRCC